MVLTHGHPMFGRYDGTTLLLLRMPDGAGKERPASCSSSFSALRATFDVPQNKLVPWERETRSRTSASHPYPVLSPAYPLAGLALVLATVEISLSPRQPAGRLFHRPVLCFQKGVDDDCDR
jgi:hypothetical protein